MNAIVAKSELFKGPTPYFCPVSQTLWKDAQKLPQKNLTASDLRQTYTRNPTDLKACEDYAEVWFGMIETTALEEAWDDLGYPHAFTWLPAHFDGHPIWCACPRWESVMLAHAHASLLVESANRAEGLQAAKWYARAAGSYEHASHVLSGWKNLPPDFSWRNARSDGNAASDLATELKIADCDQRALLCEVLAHASACNHLDEKGSAEARVAEARSARWHAVAVLANGLSDGVFAAFAEAMSCRAAAQISMSSSRWSECATLRAGVMQILREFDLQNAEDEQALMEAEAVCASMNCEAPLPYTRSFLPPRVNLIPLRKGYTKQTEENKTSQQ